jgi:hypothetical protein
MPYALKLITHPGHVRFLAIMRYFAPIHFQRLALLHQLA